MPELLTETFGVYASLVLQIARIVGLLVAAWIFFRLIDSALKRIPLVVPLGDSIKTARIEQRAETLRGVMRSVSKIVVFVILGLMISSELGFSLAPVLASVGVAGIAIGFGAQSLVKDVFAGFFILLEDQFGVGDVVRIGEHSGVVEHMTLRVTVLRNLEGEVHVIPNGNIQVVTVLTKDWGRAVVDVTVAYKEDLGRVFKLLDQVGLRLAADWSDRVMEKPTLLGIENISPDGVTIRMIVRTPPTKRWDVVREWRRRIKEEFDKHEIEVPQRATVFLETDDRKTTTDAKGNVVEEGREKKKR
jgi:small conductance mechanosensitive channel